MHFVSSSIYHKAIRLAFQEGLPPESVTHHNVPNDVRYIDISLLFDVYEQADKVLNPGFAVRQGKQLHTDDYGTLGLSWKTCWKAKEVFDRIERFMVLVTNHGHVKIEEANGMTKIHLYRDAYRKGIAIANEVTFVMVTTILLEVTNKNILPSQVSFAHERNHVSSYTDFFQCPVEFNQEVNTLQFRTSDLNISTIKADKSIHQFLIARMDEEKKGIQVNTDKWLGAIHSLIMEALPSGIPSVIQVADHIGTSARTFKRRLSDKGLTFRSLVQQIQQTVSIDLLKNSTQSIGEVAFQCGFSEQSAFNRAFKRWTGQSPVDFRKHS